MAIFKIKNKKKKKREQFDHMYKTLRIIGRGTYPVNVLSKISEERYGLLPNDAVAAGYETMQQLAKEAIRGIIPHDLKHLDD